MELFGIAHVAGITVICYLLSLGIKAWGKLKKEWIPVFCGILGGSIGVIGLYVMTDFPATDVISAIAIGVVSGLAATGVNEAYKQLKRCGRCEDTCGDKDEEK